MTTSWGCADLATADERNRCLCWLIAPASLSATSSSDHSAEFTCKAGDFCLERCVGCRGHRGAKRRRVTLGNQPLPCPVQVGSWSWRYCTFSGSRRRRPLRPLRPPLSRTTRSLSYSPSFRAPWPAWTSCWLPFLRQQLSCTKSRLSVPSHSFPTPIASFAMCRLRAAIPRCPSIHGLVSCITTKPRSNSSRG